MAVQSRIAGMQAQLPNTGFVPTSALTTQVQEYAFNGNANVMVLKYRGTLSVTASGAGASFNAVDLGLLPKGVVLFKSNVLVARLTGAAAIGATGAFGVAIGTGTTAPGSAVTNIQDSTTYTMAASTVTLKSRRTTAPVAFNNIAGNERAYLCFTGASLTNSSTGNLDIELTMQFSYEVNDIELATPLK